MMGNWKILVFSFAVINASQALAQVGLQWARCYDGPANGWDTPLAISVDDSGYVYITGAGVGIGTDRDYTTIKYDRNGDSLWTRIYNGPENAFDVARDIAVDDSGNVYVTGTSVMATIKYDRFGNELWVRRYGIASGGRRLALDPVGNIVVGGSNAGGTTGSDFIVLKYHPAGLLIWANEYNGPANGDDRINDMVVDSEGNIIVTGESRGIETNWDYATVKYSPNGDSLWVRRYSGPAPPQEPNTDFARAVTVDDEDNVYVTGWSKSSTGIPQCFTIKYSPEGDSLWGHRYPVGGTIGYAGDDILYNRGFIYVVARANGFDDTLLKYDLNGNLVWSRAYLSNHTFATNPPKLAVDTAGNIYHTSVNSVGRSDFIVLKYAPDGTRLWEFAYPDSGTNTGNEVRAIAVDKAGNVYLTGESSGWVCPGGSYDYLTLKLSQDPTSVEPHPKGLPTQVQLLQNYPNPFNASTRIEFALSRAAHVQLRVFNVLGQEVALLASEERRAGTHAVAWKAGSTPSGIYICRLQTERETRSIKLLLVK